MQRKGYVSVTRIKVQLLATMKTKLMRQMLVKQEKSLFECQHPKKMGDFGSKSILASQCRQRERKKAEQ